MLNTCISQYAAWIIFWLLAMPDCQFNLQNRSFTSGQVSLPVRPAKRERFTITKIIPSRPRLPLSSPTPSHTHVIQHFLYAADLSWFVAIHVYECKTGVRAGRYSVGQRRSLVKSTMILKGYIPIMTLKCGQGHINTAKLFGFM